MLVFAADLQQVEEVCCCAVDADCVLVGCWGWVGEVCYAEVLGALVDVLDVLLEMLFTGGIPRHILSLGYRAWWREDVRRWCRRLRQMAKMLYGKDTDQWISAEQQDTSTKSCWYGYVYVYTTSMYV